VSRQANQLGGEYDFSFPSQNEHLSPVSVNHVPLRSFTNKLQAMFYAPLCTIMHSISCTYSPRSSCLFASPPIGSVSHHGSMRNVYGFPMSFCIISCEHRTLNTRLLHGAMLRCTNDPDKPQFAENRRDTIMPTSTYDRVGV